MKAFTMAGMSAGYFVGSIICTFLGIGIFDISGFFIQALCALVGIFAGLKFYSMTH